MKFDFLLSQELCDKWGRKNGASPEELACLKECCADELPAVYLDFLAFSNGADTGIPVQPYSCILYQVKDVIELATSYDFVENLPGFFIIGSDGGGEYIILELKTSRVCCVNLPFTEEEILDIAPSFIDLLRMFGQRSEEF